MKKRDGAFDLLRCLCMLFVVIIHILGHSDFLENLTEHNLVFFLSNFMGCCVRVAVPIFVLITGYFGTSFSWKKVYNFELTMLFYGFLCMGFAVIYSGRNMEWTIIKILKTVFPFTFKSWWFATTYLVLLIFSPFVNRLLDNLSRKEHLAMLIACFFLFNVISSFSLDPIDQTGGYGFANFIFLYCVGRYIRKYAPFHRKEYIYLFGYLMCSFMILVSYVLYGNYKFGTYNSVLLFFSSLFLFAFFERHTVKSAIWSKIAPYTFAVYLISDNFFIRPILNGIIFNPNQYKDTPLVIAYVLIYAIALMLVCMGLDWIVKHLFGKIKGGIVDTLCEITNSVKDTILNLYNRIIEQHRSI